MSTKSREVIWGGQIMGADIRARQAREDTHKGAREADRADAHAWSLRMEDYGRAPPSRLRQIPMPQRLAGLAGGMIKLTEAREITPCKWVHPDEER